MTRILSAAITGLEARIIEVEVDLAQGLHFFRIVGLPDKAVEEAKERVSAAIKNSGFIPPRKLNKRLIINLAPADIKKEGPAFDLPLALAYLLASKQTPMWELRSPTSEIFAGELALDGTVRPINGALPITLLAKQEGIKTIFLPKENAKEAALVDKIKIIPVESLSQLIAHLEGKTAIRPQPPTNIEELRQQNRLDAEQIDFAYIKGQENAKRAIEIAASGGHNML